MGKKNKQNPHSGKIHIKTGDRVKVLVGDDKGEVGVVAKVLRDDYRAVVEGLNMVKRHVRPSANTPGGIVEKEAPIHISNLMLVGAEDVASRIRKEKREGKSVRVLKKTQEVIE
ncbi:MAG: 50S ribosomal protein L24 [Aureispira sp.]|nr:50S ribosomal protein L24 [Aureispira sp.]